MTIDLKYFVQTVLIFVGITLILKHWTPPIARSKQALISLALGIAVGYFLEPSKDGITTGIIASQMIFWGEDYFHLVRTTQKEIKHTAKDNVSDLDVTIKEGK